MPRIQVLSKQVAQLIAAGEVVERPASVIKELVENAIDAGAKHITVEIENGGVRMLRITDDGCGIVREDIRSAFLSHGTSKLRTEEDLHAIRTLGFRGEALPSIAAVARIELLTRAQGEQAGTRFVIEGGEELLLDEAGCPAGTTIVVRDLFYNTPARMKFLKKDVSEANAVAAVLDRLALSNPHVSFRFLREGRQALLTPGNGSLEDSVYAIFGKEFTQGLIPADYRMDGVAVKGLVSKPSYTRANRNMQFFFVNGRLVKTGTGSAALTEGYKNTIMVGKFPACILFLELAPELVDVNVHPAKIEVRFAQEKTIFNAVYFAVKNALTLGDTPIEVRPKPLQQTVLPQAAPHKQLHLPEKQPDFWKKVSVADFLGGAKSQSSAATAQAPYHAVQEADSIVLHSSEPEQALAVAEPSVLEGANWAAAKQQPSAEPPLCPEPPSSAEPEPLREEAPPPLRLIGEAFHTYILAERDDEILFIDKHAAHERMIYEKLKEQSSGRSAQTLLAPVTLTVSKEEYNAVLQELPLFEQAGFQIVDFGDGMLAVNSCPMELSCDDITHAVQELAGGLLSHKQLPEYEKLDWLYHSIACRSAVKAGDFTSRVEQEHFVHHLLSLPDIRYCPHGRPVLFAMKRRELEKSFGRI